MNYSSKSVVALRYVFLLFVLIFMNISCESNLSISRDSRFASLAARGIRTKRELRLYPPGIGVSDSGDRYSLSAGYFGSAEKGWDYVATIPAHHPVAFEKLRRTYDVTGGGEYLLGHLDYGGETYQISSWLGLLNDDSQAGWRRFFKSFEAAH